MATLTNLSGARALPHSALGSVRSVSLLVCLSALTALSAVILAGCGDNSPTGLSEHTVGPAGGTLLFAGDSVALLVPPGALSRSVTITVQVVAQFPDSPAVLPGTAYELGPADLHFDHPAALGILYNPATVPSDVPELELTIGKVSGNNWQPVTNTSVDQVDHAVGAAIDGYGVYTVMPIPVAAVRVSPASVALVFEQVAPLQAAPVSAAGDTLSRTVTWSTSNPLVATVDADGILTGAGPGSASISATSAGVEASISASVVVLDFVSVSTGGEHSCGLVTGGAAYCWGFGSALGNPPPPFTSHPNSPYPIRVSGGLTFRSLDGGQEHTCAVTLTNAAYCWGRGDAGQVGNGSTAQEGNETPQLVSGGLTWSSVSAGFEHSCGLTTDSTAYCWGNNYVGTLGNGSSENSATPVPVSGGLKWIAVEAGAFFSCGIAADSTAYCWGNNVAGKLGDGTMQDHDVPTPIAGNLKITAISAGGNYACALTAARTVYCWGANFDGSLGDGSASDHAAPAPVAGGASFTTITAGNFHTCGVDVGSLGYCWGSNGVGQLGIGSLENQPAPSQLAGGLAVRSISVSLSGISAHTCGITTVNKVYCWGTGDRGQLGHGPVVGATSPLPVVGQQD